MSHNTRVRADYAAWAIGTGVSAAEFEKFDANLFKAINGDEGGTWAPSAVIAIGGSGMQFSGSRLSVDPSGEFAVYCESYFRGASRFVGTVTAAGGLTSLENTVLGTSQSNTLTVGATSTFNAAETHNGIEMHYGTEMHNGTEMHHGTETHNEIETHYGIEMHYGNVKLLGNVTIGASDVDALLIRAAATLQGTINFTGAVSFGTDSIRDTYQEVSSAVDVTLTYTSQHINVITMTANGNVVRLTAPAGNSSRSKVIKNPASATYSYQVIDSSTSMQLAYLAPGQECTVVTTTTRWI